MTATGTADPAQRETSRIFSTPHHASPRTHLLSNGDYSVMVTAAGSGYSRWRDLAVTRWREDATRDPWGSYIFLRDVLDGRVWSAGYQPVGREPENYTVAFFADRAEITRRDGPIFSTTQILVAGGDDTEIRRVSLTNEASTAHEIELTTYAEVVLSGPDADSAHPAFSKMFVQTDFTPDRGALLATRRPREPGELQLWVFHCSSLQGTAVGSLQFETDRARFLGRGNELRTAACIVDARPLSNTVGTVLDPVLALRRRVRIEPGETVRICFYTGVSPSREEALRRVDKYQHGTSFDLIGASAKQRAQEHLQVLGVSAEDAGDFQELANPLLYCDPAQRAPAGVLGGQSGPPALWAHGISGDFPIVLVRVTAAAGVGVVDQLLLAQQYWRLKRLTADLVLINDCAAAEAAAVQEAVQAAIAAAKRRAGNNMGTVSLLQGATLDAAARGPLEIAARVLIVADRGKLHDHLPLPPTAAPRRRLRRENLNAAQRTETARTPAALEFFNGLGGFSAEGREYVIKLGDGQWTPAPWVNVIANPEFGFQSSADGAGSAWSQNAQQNKLTPWSNDPVSNAPAEAIYVRDEATGDLWSPTPLPIREPSFGYEVRHGFGFTRCAHASHGIALELLQFVPLEDPIKISRLKLINRTAQVRSLSVTHYVDWVLGNQRSRTAPYVVTEIEPKTGAMLAHSPWNTDFQSRVAFMDMRGRQHTVTADRTEFIGRHGSLAEPAALLGFDPLSNRVGAGLDPCGAMQTSLELTPGGEVEIVFLLGEEGSADEAIALIERYRTVDLDAALERVGKFWDRTLGAVQVKTPDRSMDILLNGWLLYQVLACRVWGRTAFYQSSGAYGYRDQLQDVMALCISAPAIAREHILRAAGRQFVEGDVQHWWLPATGQGIKTRVADDRIWLPFVASYYLEVTQDFALLDTTVDFLGGGPLTAEQREVFSAPPTGPSATLYEHCVRALDSSLTVGVHGLPLFGTGDWNDGMNRVGAGGKGESVWMGWFLYAALLRFAPIAERRGDTDNALRWRKHALGLQQSIERNAWDGDWYRRGYFDDGTPLGSVCNDECRIDSVAQSWAVISGAAERGRARRAMTVVNTQLVVRSDGLVKLFTPAFDRTAHDPGYIKAYPPGLRENGGQYTHAAMWTTLAFAMLGNGDRAVELFSLLNPINHASTRAGIYRYKVEPYVVCADVYSAPAHVGRGGWTWYTGSAAWMYRTGVEGILGITLHGDILRVDPCIPRAWPGFEFTYKHRSSRYRIAVENPRGVNRGVVSVTLDGQELVGKTVEIKLLDDGRYHYGKVVLG